MSNPTHLEGALYSPWLRAIGWLPARETLGAKVVRALFAIAFYTLGFEHGFRAFGPTGTTRSWALAAVGGVVGYGIQRLIAAIVEQLSPRRPSIRLRLIVYLELVVIVTAYCAFVVWLSGSLA